MAATTTARISATTSATLDQLVEKTGSSKIELIERAVAKLKQDLFWEAVEAGYEEHGDALRSEYAETDGASADGLGGW
ncbi:MAG TPA: ribbon-helix-helix protein, CopG family [Oscillatoriaceae cyanobacterium]